MLIDPTNEMEVTDKIIDTICQATSQKPAKSPSTKKGYYNDVHTLKEFCVLESKKRNLVINLFSLTSKDANEAYFRYLVFSRKFEKSTIIRNLRNLKKFYREGMILHLFKSNPFLDVEIPEQDIGEKVQKELLTKEQVADILNSAEQRSLRDYLIVILILFCRMLPIDVRNLTWCNIQIDEENDTYLADVITRSKIHKSVLLNSYICKKLLQYRLEQGKPLDTWSMDEDRVFVSNRFDAAGTDKDSSEVKRRGISESLLRNIISSICKAAGVPDKSALDLAHEFIYIGRSEGATDDELLAQAGFKLKKVLRKYDKIRPKVEGVALKINIEAYKNK